MDAKIGNTYKRNFKKFGWVFKSNAVNVSNIVLSLNKFSFSNNISSIILPYTQFKLVLPVAINVDHLDNPVISIYLNLFEERNDIDVTSVHFVKSKNIFCCSVILVNEVLLLSINFKFIFFVTFYIGI